MGNKLYEYYDTGPGSSYPTSWRDKFLSREIAKPESGDVLYLAGTQASFAQIDVWTDTWRDIRDNILIDPVTGDVFNFSTLSSLQNIGLFVFNLNIHINFLQYCCT